MAHKPVMTAAELSEYVETVFSQSTMYNWAVQELREGAITVVMKTGESDIRPGGTVSGPTMFALADIAAYMLILGHIGKVALAVTTSLNINFLSKPEPGDLVAIARLIKLGKRLAVCEIWISSGHSDVIVAQATATYSIPPR
ncbi:MAG: PaaI family thioesterase [Salaquimonas sp.]